MQLPFTVVIEPPGRAELRWLGRSRRTQALAALLLAAGCGGAVLTTGLLAAPRAGETGGPEDATLGVTSDPVGASIEVEGHARGQPPARVPGGRGAHQVILRAPGYLDASYLISVEDGQVARVHAELWRRTPTAGRVLPPFPGAAIIDVRFFADGTLSLTLAAARGPERQLWQADG